MDQKLYAWTGSWTIALMCSVQYVINIFWNEKYAVNEPHQRALNIKLNVDLGEEA